MDIARPVKDIKIKSKISWVSKHLSAIKYIMVEKYNKWKTNGTPQKEVEFWNTTKTRRLSGKIRE